MSVQPSADTSRLAAATIVTDDPVFGLVALGGAVARTEGGFEVTPRDGLRKHVHVILGDRRLHLSLERDGFESERPVLVVCEPSWKIFCLIPCMNCHQSMVSQKSSSTRVWLRAVTSLTWYTKAASRSLRARKKRT